MRKKNMKRPIAFFICLLMVVACIPFSVSAADGATMDLDKWSYSHPGNDNNCTTCSALLKDGIKYNPGSNLTFNLPSKQTPGAFVAIPGASVGSKIVAFTPTEDCKVDYIMIKAANVHFLFLVPDGVLHKDVAYTVTCPIKNAISHIAFYQNNGLTPPLPPTKDAEVEVGKSVVLADGATGQIPAGTFHFELQAAGEVVIEATITTDSTGNVKFVPDVPLAVGEYTIKEKMESATGWAYDDAEYTVIVDNNGDVTYNTTDGNFPVFVNKYGVADVKGNKEIAYDEKKGNAPERTFTFNLLDSAEKVVATASVDAANWGEDYSFTFSPKDAEAIPPGTYTMVEVKGSSGNWTYDETKFTVTIHDDYTVTYADKDGNRLTLEQVVFENSYKKTSGGNNTPGGNTPGGNTPGGNTPGGNDNPGGDNPGGEEPGDTTTSGGIDRPSNTPPTTHGSRMVPTGDGRYEVIGDDGVPLGMWHQDPEGVWIFDEYPPLSNIPQTGVEGAALYLTLFGLALLSLGAIFFGRKKAWENN